jgi:hypothetical protein
MPFFNNHVKPSLVHSRRAGATQDTGGFSTYGLLQGEVKKILYPDTPENPSKEVRYKVDVQFRRGSEPAYSVTFPSVGVSTLFGGPADQVRYTLRADPETPKQGQTVGVGAQVLLLCVSGDVRRAYIIGGLQNGIPESAEDGHNYSSEFNGFSHSVDKDGQALFAFRGATNTDGTLAPSADPAAENATISFTKDGSITIISPGDQSIRVNHANKSIEIVADAEWNVQVKGNTTIQTDGTTTVDSGGTTTVNSGGRVSIQSPGVTIGAGTQQLMMGTTYRAAETVLHGALQALAAAINTAGVQMGLVPVGGAMMAGPTLTAAAAAFAAALAAFEAASPAYLSTKNRND